MYKKFLLYNTMKLTNVAYIVFLLLSLNKMASVAIQGQHITNSVVSCEDGKRKLLCLPSEYSKFDLPHRNAFNVIDIGKQLN